MLKYKFAIGVDNIESFILHKTSAVSEYQNIHKYRLNFPDFDDECESLDTHYGGGPTKFLVPELIMFTSKFPTFTFLIILTYQNNEKAYLISIRDREILSTLYISSNEIVKMHYHDISDWFTYYTDLEVFKAEITDDN